MNTNEVRGVSNMTQLNDSRFLKTLDKIDSRLDGIESDLKEVITLNERVKHHTEELNRHQSRLEVIDSRQRAIDISLVQVESYERSIKHTQKELDNFKEDANTEFRKMDRSINSIRDQMSADILELSKKLDRVKTSGDNMKGRSDVKTHVFKWTAGILGAVLMYVLTGK